MKVDFSSLEKAVSQLQKSFNYLYSEMAEDEELREQFRAATIQAFEYTYALAIKMIRRQLSVGASDSAEVEAMSFPNLIRDAAKVKMISDPVAYMDYRDMRNRTSHTYDDEQAEATVAIVGKFLEDMRSLLKELTRRNS